MTPKLKVKHVELTERRVDFLHPFRFGDVTVMSAPQAFVHVDIEIDGRRSTGASAELMVPKWFDKNPALGIEETIAELRASIVIARDLYLEDRAPDTAFGIHAAIYKRQIEACARAGLPALPSLFGPAEIDKAIVDALLRALDLDVFDGLKRNVVGLDNRLTGDLEPSALQAFLDDRTMPATINLRHTVGMVDAVDSLREVAADHGARYFKIKLCGDPDRDIARLDKPGRRARRHRGSTTARRSTPMSNMPSMPGCSTSSPGSPARAGSSDLRAVFSISSSRCRAS